MLADLDKCAPHLNENQRQDVITLIKLYLCLFSDVPTRTHVLQNNFDVGDSPPIKQHAYRVNPEKRMRLQKQVNYMLENGISELSCSSWSSPCVLVVKSDSTVSVQITVKSTESASLTAILFPELMTVTITLAVPILFQTLTF